MTISGWVSSQSTLVKLGLGIGFGFIVYILFRYFIYTANKASKRVTANTHRSNWSQNLRRLVD